MADNPVQVLDIEDRWRPLAAEERTVAQAVLDDAWVVLQARLPALSARLDAGTIDVGLVRWAVRSAALRELKNPDGVTMRQRSLADYTEQDQFAAPVQAAFYTAGELELLGAAVNAGQTTAGAFTIHPGAVAPERAWDGRWR